MLRVPQNLNICNFPFFAKYEFETFNFKREFANNSCE
jgi:hypothetical protein